MRRPRAGNLACQFGAFSAAVGYCWRHFAAADPDPGADVVILGHRRRGREDAVTRAATLTPKPYVRFPTHDVAFNVRRLRREGKTKIGRADALEAWWEIKKGSETPPAAA